MGDHLWPRASAWLVDASSVDRADVDVIGVPSSIASISQSDARLAPSALREALRGFSPFDSDRNLDLGTVVVADHGDIALDDTSMGASQRDIASRAATIDASGVRAYIGGDNAITRPLVGALDFDLGSVGVITLDAHHDVRSLDGGPTNGTPMRGLVEDGLPGRNVAQIGIHSFANSAPYRAACEDFGFAIFTMEDVDRRGIRGVVDAALYRLGHVDAIYVDFDIDVLDRAYAPGCPGARPAGMTPRQLGNAAFALGREPRVVAADFVEVDPGRDRDGTTIQSMAHTFLSFVAGIATRRDAP
jgi:formimidoylglutamase